MREINLLSSEWTRLEMSPRYPLPYLDSTPPFAFATNSLFCNGLLDSADDNDDKEPRRLIDARAVGELG